MSETCADKNCPLCQRPNQCRITEGRLYKGPCWCEQVTVPAPVQRQLAAELPPGCLCPDCLNAIASWSRDMESPANVVARARRELSKAPPATALSAEDFYLDERGLMVFTEAYHRKRGYCCDSGCRHCPY